MAKRMLRITSYDNGTAVSQLTVPKSTNITLLVERLICRHLDDDTLVASCLRKNSKGYWDPFGIHDLRDEHRRDQVKSEIDKEMSASEFCSTYAAAFAQDIPLGKILIMTQSNPQFFVKEVEV